MSTSAAESPPSRPAICPRCGYDLAGAVTAWGSDSCPMKGLCSECGHAFEWADVLAPVRQRVLWLYEHAPHWWSARSAIATLLLALLPNVFWRRVQPHHYVQPQRLAAWPVALLLGWAVLWATASIALDIWISMHTRGTIIDLHRVEEYIIRSGAAQLGLDGDWWSSSRTPSYLLVFVAFAAGAASVGLAAPSFWSNARVRAAHIVRITVYSLTPGFVLHAAWAACWLWVRLADAQYAGLPLPGSLQLPDDDIENAITGPPFALAILGALIWQSVFWPFALRRGLRMKPGAAASLGSLCVFTGLLAACTAMVCVFT